MTATPQHVFVYGTLRSDAGADAARLLMHSTKRVGRASIRARLFDLGEYPGIELSDNAADVVVGELFELDAITAPQVLTALDEYEGLGPNEPEPAQYERVTVPVKPHRGRTVTAWVYVLKPDHPHYPRIPGGDYSAWKEANR